MIPFCSKTIFTALQARFHHRELSGLRYCYSSSHCFLIISFDNKHVNWKRAACQDEGHPADYRIESHSVVKFSVK
ncbi:hypothetical protein HMPREF9103_03161 [Lentilactobacillus parafarraginis F0439]|uniref:Uncharacterized protein n=1 Tax=Lentilactobacillus parafarraginis F0439 TaxID=797515 RepID=G9ZTS6_9LACO|nr:hypothetical protein HMPREF9103_03161 [Lentilactobacillus parafarraginis F0439]